MGSDSLHLETILAAALFCGARVAGLMTFAPFLSSESISLPLKAALTVALTALLYPAYGPRQLAVTGNGWVGVVMGEVVVGLLLGLTAQFVVEAAQVAGQLMGMQAGYSLVTLLDPQSQADTPALAIFNQLLALLIFLELNVHHWILRGLAASFAYLPAGSAAANLRVTGGLLAAAGGIWRAGLQIAAPVIAATVLVDVAMGFVAKASPQIPVLFLGLPVKTMLTLSILAGTLKFWPQTFADHFASGLKAGERLLHLAH